MRTYYRWMRNEMFLTLQEAKKHIWLAYTPKECIKELTDTYSWLERWRSTFFNRYQSK